MNILKKKKKNYKKPPFFYIFQPPPGLQGFGGCLKNIYIPSSEGPMLPTYNPKLLNTFQLGLSGLEILNAMLGIFSNKESRSTTENPCTTEEAYTTENKYATEEAYTTENKYATEEAYTTRNKYATKEGEQEDLATVLIGGCSDDIKDPELHLPMAYHPQTLTCGIPNSPFTSCVRQAGAFINNSVVLCGPEDESGK